MNSKIIAVIFLLFLLFSTTAFAKSYTLEKAQTDYFIQSDGTVLASEQITFNFNGSYSFAYRTIPNTVGEVYDVQVFDDQNNELELDTTIEDNQTKYTWHFSAQDEVKTFTLYYNIDRGLNSYENVTEFFWQVWGNGWGVPLQELDGSITLPAPVNDPKEVYTYGHPTINGKIGILDDNQTIVFQVFDVPSNQEIEIRTVFPTALLESRDNTNPKTGDGLAVIAQQERVLNDPSLYIQNQFQEAIPDLTQLLIQLLTVPILVMVLFFGLWFAFGREPNVNVPELYEHEPPFDYSPAIVSCLLSQSEPKPGDVFAVILNLCLKGYLKLEKSDGKTILSKDTYQIVYQPKCNQKEFLDLAPHETTVLNWLFQFFGSPQEVDGGTLRQFTMQAESSFVFATQFNTWASAVKQEADAMGFFEKNRWPPIIAVALLAMFFGTFIFALSNQFGWAISCFVGIFTLMILWIVFPQALPKRTPKGAEHYIKWLKLKAFLQDFSQLKNVSPDSIVLWEQYLVYAVPLGAAEKVEKAMKLVFKDYNKPIQSSFISSGYRGFNGAEFSLLASQFNSASHEFNSQISRSTSTSGSSGFSGSSSHSSGGGGGFSGGGGGGGAG